MTTGRLWELAVLPATSPTESRRKWRYNEVRRAWQPAQRIAHVGSWEWDVRTNTAQWSEETFQIFGVTPSDMGNHRQEFLDRVHPQDRARVNQALSDALSGASCYDLNYRILLPGNSEKVIHALAEVIRDGAGKPVWMRGTVHDITERERAEQEKLEMERRLLHAQKLESTGILAGGIAHDFNNILAGIMGYADLARLRLPESEAAREDIEVIKKAVQRAADLTRQMLAYSGKGRFIVEPVDLSRVVEDSKKMLAMFVSKKATVTYNLTPICRPFRPTPPKSARWL